MATCAEVLNESTLDILRGATLTEERARAIFALGEEAVIFALLELTKQLSEQKAAAAGTSHQTPATPSGMKPPYEKPPAKSRKKRPGAKKGHPGSRRKVPGQIDWQVEHRLSQCPDCGGRLKRTGSGVGMTNCRKRRMPRGGVAWRFASSN
jgi:hypothetical protein